MRPTENDYGNLVEKWKVKLIVTRARRMGFRADEIEDAQQEIVLDVMAFRFDAGRSNGAAEPTALTALIDNRLRSIRRARRRYEKQLERLKADLGVDEARDRRPQPEEDQRHLLVVDVRSAVARLAGRQRAICDALAAGDSLRDAAAKARCCRDTTARVAAELRRQFRNAGLSAWVEG